ncbi:tryptophan-rich sensory protein [Krasilnikoviella flava]|uniref:TspO and MBR related proteins n=1 Tax=Krasilnikoviella flava TaxID=526729 RepID=A0A1T5LYG7_9MICO|nr:tryptophan-rich sensory protein [Krasilnikoviella flava]SKC81040.1 TspO and MBR related proteins [Krasilnikoviella flava]
MVGSTAGLRPQQIVVTASLLVCVVGSMIGVGVFGGTPIAEAAGGALAADATLVAPASPAFSIWTVIYLGLAGYTVFQWLPAHAADDRQRRLRLPVATTMLLNAAWILVVQAGALWWSVLVIVALLALLVRTFLILVRTPASGVAERVLVDGTLGLYLGWVCVATVANVAAALAAAGFDGAGVAPDWWAVGILAAVAGVGVALAVRGRGRVAVGAAIAWGLAWVAVARSQGDPPSAPAAASALAAAVLVLGVALVLSVRTAVRARSGVGS